MHGRAPATTGRSSRRTPKSKQLGVAMRENMVFICKPSAVSADGELFASGRHRDGDEKPAGDDLASERMTWRFRKIAAVKTFQSFQDV